MQDALPSNWSMVNLVTYFLSWSTKLIGHWSFWILTQMQLVKIGSSNFMNGRNWGFKLMRIPRFISKELKFTMIKSFQKGIFSLVNRFCYLILDWDCFQVSWNPSGLDHSSSMKLCHLEWWYWRTQPPKGHGQRGSRTKHYLGGDIKRHTTVVQLKEAWATTKMSSLKGIKEALMGGNLIFLNFALICAI